MQTFLPYSSFYKTALCLDWRRLGKERVETWQIYKTLIKGSRWKNHPAVKMWKGYEGYLILYGMIICQEWRKRGYKDKMLKRFLNAFYTSPGLKMEPPKWLGNKPFHSIHRSVLLAKNHKWYKQFNWEENPATKNSKGKWPYIWPLEDLKTNE